MESPQKRARERLNLQRRLDKEARRRDRKLARKRGDPAPASAADSSPEASVVPHVEPTPAQPPKDLDR